MSFLGRFVLLYLAALAYLPATSLKASSEAGGGQVKTWHGANFEFNYLLYLPAAYARSEEQWPLLVFLHGSGECGSDLSLVRAIGVPREISNGREVHAVTVAPQCPEGERWDPRALEDFIVALSGVYKIDKARIYLTGISMGGTAVWQLAQQKPDLYAGIVPICGRGDASKARNIVDIPTWIFHGALDQNVPLRWSTDMMAAIKEAGGQALLTIYPDMYHDCWTRVYATDAVYEWMLKQKTKQASGLKTVRP